MKQLISITDLSRAQIATVLAAAVGFKQNPNQPLLQNKIIASCFFEPSTRTRLSFETAVLRLGGKVIGFSDSSSTSTQKGESLQDSTRMVMSYADGMIIRHPEAGAAEIAAQVSDKPIINAGDGGNQHPTQTLVDLFSMQETQGQLDYLKVALVGDLKYGRTIHSLVQAGALFNMEFYLVSPDSLPLPEKLVQWLQARNIKLHQGHSLQEVIPRVDIVYMTRLQKERFAANETADIAPFTLKAAMLKQAKQNLKVLHPLPRVDEIHVDVDTTPYAYYFQQAANGVPVRQALLAQLFG